MRKTDMSQNGFLHSKNSGQKCFFRFSKIFLVFFKIRDFQMTGNDGYEIKLEEILRLMAENKIPKI